MARFVFVTWNGGGNLTPALGIARVLAEHQHTVTFLGEETQRQRVEAAGLAFTAYSPRGAGDSGAPTTPLERQRQLIRDFWMNTALADDLLTVLAREPADMVVVDCMLAGVLANSARFGAPAAVLVHSLYGPVLPMRDLLVMMGNQLRVEAGLPALDPATVQWEHKDLVLVTTLREFDGVTESAPNVRYVGPVLDPQPTSTDWRLPWESDDPRPLVLASFSMMPGQTSPAKLNLVLDALQSLPLRVVLTTGTVPPETLTPPANAAVLSYIPHAAILPYTALEINHGGHGSVMAALAQGVPLVCMPGLGADQDLVAGRVSALGVGKAISSQATAIELRSAVEEVLAAPAYRTAAGHLATLIAQQDGATGGASALEACIRA
ncbi:MAG: glycosyltransferase [Ktedonobacterales bacterium]